MRGPFFTHLRTNPLSDHYPQEIRGETVEQYPMLNAWAIILGPAARCGLKTESMRNARSDCNAHDPAQLIIGTWAAAAKTNSPKSKN
jgi:hypothetical protein